MKWAIAIAAVTVLNIVLRPVLTVIALVIVGSFMRYIRIVGTLWILSALAGCTWYSDTQASIARGVNPDLRKYEAQHQQGQPSQKSVR